MEERQHSSFLDNTCKLTAKQTACYQGGDLEVTPACPCQNRDEVWGEGAVCLPLPCLSVEQAALLPPVTMSVSCQESCFSSQEPTGQPRVTQHILTGPAPPHPPSVLDPHPGRGARLEGSGRGGRRGFGLNRGGEPSSSMSAKTGESSQTPTLP